MTSPEGSSLHAARWLHGSGVMTWRRVYPGWRGQIPRARSWSRLLLADTTCVEEAALIVSELAGNALLHTRSGQAGGWFGVQITRGRQVCVAVHDLGGNLVPRLTAGTQASEVLPENGYGLQVVQNMATHVGVAGNPTGGHTVWALLTSEPSPAVQRT